MDILQKEKEAVSQKRKQATPGKKEPSRQKRGGGKKEQTIPTQPKGESTSLLDSIRDAFFAVDQHWRVTYINKKASELIHIKSKELVGKSLWELWPRYRHTSIEDLLRQAMDERIPVQGSFRGLYTDRSYEARIYPSGDGLAAFLFDKSEVIRKEQESERNRIQLAGFLESTHESFFAMDRDWRIIYANQHFGEVVKRDPAELTGKYLWKEFPKYIGTEVEANYRRAMEDRTSVQFEAGGFYSDSWYEITAFPTAEGISVFATDRSKEKKTLERLRESEERLQELNRDLETRNHQLEEERERWQGVVEGIAEEVWLSDAEGRMSLVNVGEISQMGLTEFKGKTIQEVLDEVEIFSMDGKVRPADEAPLLVSLTGKVVRGEEIMRHRKSGKTRYREFSSAPTRDEKGNIIGAVAIVRDITATKEIQNRLEHAHRQTREILESIGDSFYHLDQNWRFTYINQQSADLWHKTREELLGKSIWEVFPSMAGSEMQQAHLEAVDKKQPIHLEAFSGILNSWISLSLYPTEDGLSVYFRDISQQKQAEEVLRFSEEKFSLAFANSPAALVLTSLEDGIFMDVNATWEQLTGYTCTEAIGQSSMLLSLWPNREARDRFANELRRKGSLHWEEQEFMKKSGEIFLADISAQVLIINERKMVLSTLIDITERKRQQEALREAAEKLARSNKELQEFAYVASHDLQEPLRKVSVFGNDLFQKLEPVLSEHDRDLFTRLINATTRMQVMIQDLLELSRITTQGEPFKEVDLKKVAKDVLADLEVLLTTETGKVFIGKLPRVMGDPNQIHRLLMNLIGNGVKYHRAEVPPIIRVNGRRFKKDGRQMLEIRVEDNGIGFDMEHAERIFQPFQRLHGRSEYEGTGMGLAICKRIVERHGGTIWARSEPSKGSTFIVILPINEENQNN